MYLRNFGRECGLISTQTNFHLRLTRPKQGLYTAENIGADCRGFDPSAIAGLPGTNNGISLFGVADDGIPEGAYGAVDLTTGTSIVPSQRRQYRPRSGGTGVRVCSSTPPGVYADTFIALDGRGGHRAYRYSVEVAIEKTETGSATWYANKMDAPTDQAIFDELQQGLVTHLTFDGTRINSAPRENYGATYSANFDGSTQYVQGPLAQAVTGQVEIPDGDWPSALRDGAYSISFWARLGAEANCGGSSANNVLLKLGEENGGIVFKTGCNQNDGNTEYSGWVLGLHAHQLPAQETWHHYVVTADAENNVRLYIDGVEGPMEQPLPGIFPVVRVFSWALAEGCDCAIDDFRIYDRQLDQIKVSQLFSLGSGEPLSEDDADDDGVSDDVDAFPNDPAASVDTDGDGNPDDWNEGKSEADSTSDPALVLDDDDDNDGYSDSRDDFPVNGYLHTKFTNDINECLSDYCVAIGGTAQYVFSLTSEFREYRFQHGLKIESIRWGGGNNTFAFDYENEQGVQTWSVDTQEGGSIEIDESFIDFKEALEWSEGRIRLRANQGFVNSGYQYIDLVTSQGVIRITVSATPPEPIGALNIIQSALQFTPPAVGTGGVG